MVIPFLFFFFLVFLYFFQTLLIICEAQIRPALQMQFCHTHQTVSPDFCRFCIFCNFEAFSSVSWLPVNVSVKEQQPKRGFKQDVYSNTD